MSRWTDVIGAVRVSAYEETTEACEYVIKNCLNHLPKIDGSERPVSFWVTSEPAHSTFCNCDEFYQHSNLGTGWDSSFDVQTNFIITLSGSLRDRVFETTYKDVIKWLNRLSKRLQIRYLCIRVSEEDHTAVITSSEWRENFEYETSWSKKLRRVEIEKQRMLYGN